MRAALVPAFGIVMGIFPVVGGIATMGKTDKQSRAEQRQKDITKQDAIQKKIEERNRQASGSGGKIVTSEAVLERAKLDQGKLKVKQAKKANARGASASLVLKERPAGKLGNCRPTGIVSEASSSSALSAVKVSVAGTKNYIEDFEKKNGSAVTELVRALSKRHCMVNPGMHPMEPYVECFEETWLPLQESRDPEGEEMVKNIAQKLRSNGTMFEVCACSRLRLCVCVGARGDRLRRILLKFCITGPNVSGRLHFSFRRSHHRWAKCRCSTDLPQGPGCLPSGCRGHRVEAACRVGEPERPDRDVFGRHRSR